MSSRKLNFWGLRYLQLDALAGLSFGRSSEHYCLIKMKQNVIRSIGKYPARVNSANPGTGEPPSQFTPQDPRQMAIYAEITPQLASTLRSP